jgi:hypothetical protein
LILRMPIVRSTAVAALIACLAVVATSNAAERRANGSDAAQSRVADDPRVDRLTDLVVEMVPVGKIMGMVAGTNPKWPMHDNPGTVDDRQLACLRGELNDASYRRMKRAEVADYVIDHPDSVDAQIALLESGPARFFGLSALGGARSRLLGEKFDADALERTASTAELEAVERVAGAAEYRELRDLSGLTVLLNAGNPQIKKSANGMTGLLSSIFLRAMERCEVDLPESAE